MLFVLKVMVELREKEREEREGETAIYEKRTTVCRTFMAGLAMAHKRDSGIQRRSGLDN